MKTNAEIGRPQAFLRQARNRYGQRNRTRKAQFAIDFGRSRTVRSVLLVGVAPDRDYSPPWAPQVNLVERRIEASFDRVVASGLGENGSGWREYVTANALDLPFHEGEFDLVYSNAVIEHVGQDEEQAQFVAEHNRVGRHWIITTPNRLFPVESHTLMLFRHMDSRWRPGGSPPPYTRLLSARDITQLIPPTAVVHGSAWSPTLTAASG